MMTKEDIRVLPYKRLVKALRPLSSSDDIIGEWHMVAKTIQSTDTCACGKSNIIYNYQIHNKITKADIIIGSECIKYFNSRDMDTNVKAVMWCVGSTVNPPLRVVERAYKVWGIITERDYKFIVSLGRKRSLSIKQGKWKDSILNKMYKFINTYLVYKLD